MRKRLAFVATAIGTAAVLAMSSGLALAGHKIQDTDAGTITLDREDGAPEQATGRARITLGEDQDGYHSLRVRLRASHLLPKAGTVYQVWLRDNDKDFDQPLTTFTTRTNGNRTVTARTAVPHFAEYDEIFVTTEDQHDEDPTRNGDVVLRGDLAH